MRELTVGPYKCTAISTSRLHKHKLNNTQNKEYSLYNWFDSRFDHLLQRGDFIAYLITPLISSSAVVLLGK